MKKERKKKKREKGESSNGIIYRGMPGPCTGSDLCASILPSGEEENKRKRRKEVVATGRQNRQQQGGLNNCEEKMLGESSCWLGVS